MLIAFEGRMDRWLWETLTGDISPETFPKGSRARHDAIVRRRVGMPLLNTIKPKDLGTAFIPHKLLGFWDPSKHNHDALFKPSNSAKERALGGYVFDVSEEQYSSLKPLPKPWKPWLDQVGEGKQEHIEQLFDRQVAISSEAAKQFETAIDIMYGRAPIPEKIRAKANKRFAKAVQGLDSATTELHVWDLSLEATPDLSRFPNTLDLSIGYNDFTVLDGLSAVPKVEKLNLENCSSLIAISDDISELTELRELNLSSCSRLLALPEALRAHPHLEVLNLFRCPVALDIDMIASFPKLKEVTLPRGFNSEPDSGARVEESKAAMVELSDNLRAMRPDITIHQFEEDLRMYYWL